MSKKKTSGWLCRDKRGGKLLNLTLGPARPWQDRCGTWWSVSGKSLFLCATARDFSRDYRLLEHDGTPAKMIQPGDCIEVEIEL